MIEGNRRFAITLARDVMLATRDGIRLEPHSRGVRESISTDFPRSFVGNLKREEFGTRDIRLSTV